MDGREAMVTPERTLLSTLRRDSLDMVDTPSVPKKSPMREEKLLFRGLGALRRRGRGGFREFDTPDVFVRWEAENADLIGFGGADLADPDNTETGCSPTAAAVSGSSTRPMSLSDWRRKTQT